MFEKLKGKREAKAYQEAVDGWKQRRDGHAEPVEVAQTFHGVGSDDVMLTSGEAIFYQVTAAALVEEQRGTGHWQGGSKGVSIPIGSLGGRSARYRVGVTRGHNVQGAPNPTAVARGTAYITNKRVIFQGANQTKERDFAKLLGFRHSDSEGLTTFSLSNRQKPTTLPYGADLSPSFDFPLDLALAHFRGTTAQLIDNLRNDPAQIDAARPAAPAGAST